MKLNGITDNPGAKKSRVRVGRGIGSGCGKLLKITVGLHNHQMHIERLLSNLLNVLQDWEAKRNIRNKNTIHHIYVKPIGYA